MSNRFVETYKLSICIFEQQINIIRRLGIYIVMIACGRMTIDHPGFTEIIAALGQMR